MNRMESSCSEEDEDYCIERQRHEDGGDALTSSLTHTSSALSQMDMAVPVSLKRKISGRGRSGELAEVFHKHKRRPSSTVPAVPDACPESISEGSNGVVAMVGNRSSVELYENYTKDEQALNSFQKLHPMLSMERTCQKAMQCVSNLLDKTEIPTVELPCVGKSYDDRFLKAPCKSAGERECCSGGNCMCLMMAEFRYGENNNAGFICKEFLLPEQQRTFEKDGTLPLQPSKCLVCTRYYTTYQYRVARCDPNFVCNTRISVQAYANVIGHTDGQSVPSSSSYVGGSDGYHPSVCLAVDTGFANTNAGRGLMGTMLWRPFVAFHSGHYKYVWNEGEKYILQVGVHADETPHFGAEQEVGESAPGPSPDR